MTEELHFILKHSLQLYTSIFGYQKYFFQLSIVIQYFLAYSTICQY